MNLEIFKNSLNTSKVSIRLFREPTIESIEEAKEEANLVPKYYTCKDLDTTLYTMHLVYPALLPHPPHDTSNDIFNKFFRI